MDNILILGVGNILFTDEGIGVYAVNTLQQQYSFSDNIRVIDGGTLGTSLMGELMSCDKVFILDAVLGGDAPGTVYRLTDDNLRKSMSFRDSLHQTDLVDTLISCELLGKRPEAVVLGMEPEDYHTLSTCLSKTCEDKIPYLCERVIDELTKTYPGSIKLKKQN